MNKINSKNTPREQRRMKSRNLIYYLESVDKETDKTVGFIVDIMSTGIMLISETLMETGKIFYLRILLKTDLSEKTHLNFDAKSKWCKKASIQKFMT